MGNSCYVKIENPIATFNWQEGHKALPKWAFKKAIRLYSDCKSLIQFAKVPFFFPRFTFFSTFAK